MAKVLKFKKCKTEVPKLKRCKKHVNNVGVTCKCGRGRPAYCRGLCRLCYDRHLVKRNMKEGFCECGNRATIKLSEDVVCQRCFDIDLPRKRTNVVRN